MSYIKYEVANHIAKVTLNRPEANNAQSAQLLAELDETFNKAVDDDEVRVIILRAEGKHFSAGHDISPEVVKHPPWSNMFDNMSTTGMLRYYNWEEKHFFGYSRRWRDLPKPTIASVQGACIAAGLMLAWPMDIIIAADNAKFSDPVARMGIGGVEYQGHAWEFGARKAKELLYTGNFIDAEEAHRLGMVNKVVPLAELDKASEEMAAQIAVMNPHATRMAKRTINAQLDAMGMHAGLNHAYDIHAMGHANAWAMCGQVTTAGLAEMTEGNKKSTKA